MPTIPLLIEFVAGSRVHREPDVTPKISIVQNGPPGTQVIFSDGQRVPLPTDQITFTDNTGGAARVGFGGMRFDGVESGRLVFLRVRDLQPAHTLSPQRGQRMTLEPNMVEAVIVDGKRVWWSGLAAN